MKRDICAQLKGQALVMKTRHDTTSLLLLYVIWVVLNAHQLRGLTALGVMQANGKTRHQKESG